MYKKVTPLEKSLLVNIRKLKKRGTPARFALLTRAFQTGERTEEISLTNQEYKIVKAVRKHPDSFLILSYSPINRDHVLQISKLVRTPVRGLLNTEFVLD